jgi:hypothetical protein
MALGGHSIDVDTQSSNPGVLNKWLQQNAGYVQGTADLKESAVPHIAPRRIAYVGPLFNNTAMSPAQIKRALDTRNRVVIFNVMHGHHFVLATGYTHDSDDVFYVHDPGFTKSTYSLRDDVVGFRLFQMH